MSPPQDETSSNESVARNGNDSFARLVVLFVIFPLLLLATYFIGQKPYVVTSYPGLGQYVTGKRVGFRCEYRGMVGTYGHVEFDGKPILLRYPETDGIFEPKVGGTYRVIGEIRRLGRPIGTIEDVVDYIIADAELQPVTQQGNL